MTNDNGDNVITFAKRGEVGREEPLRVAIAKAINAAQGGYPHKFHDPKNRYAKQNLFEAGYVMKVLASRGLILAGDDEE